LGAVGLACHVDHGVVDDAFGAMIHALVDQIMR
jgi:hypothetical protein